MKFNLTSEQSLDVYTAAALNLIDGVTRVTALGNNPDVDTAAAEDVWSGGGEYPWLSAVTSLEVVSSNVNDSAAGTGARTLRIDGLDANYRMLSQGITLNGTAAVQVPTQLIRVNSALITSAGTGRVNAGDISIRIAGGGTTISIVPAGIGITRQSIYTVPDNHTLAVHSMVFGINRPTVGSNASVCTFIQPSTGGFYRLPLELPVSGGPYRHDGIPGIILPSRTDFCLRCTSVSVGNTDITAAWLGMLFDNNKMPG